MKKSNKTAMLATTHPASHAIMNQTLAEVAAETPGLDRTGKDIINRTPGFGVMGYRETLLKLVAWADDNGVFEQAFPLDAVRDDS